MLTEAIMHDCVVKLLKNHDEESLECLCRLLTTIGKDLDFEKAKVKTPNLRNLRQGLFVSCGRSRLSTRLSISPQQSRLLVFLLLPFSLSLLGHHAPYHIFIKVRSEEGPKLYKSQFMN